MHPEHFELDVSTDNERAMGFYHRIGLTIEKLYKSGTPSVEFATFHTQACTIKTKTTVAAV